MATENIIEFKNVNKSFGGIHALSDVNFAVRKGTVHALLGENGAGKSTLMKILSGVYHKDSGQTFVDGKEVEIENYAFSQQLGIALVPQELSFVSYFTVAENIFLGREPRIPGTMLVDWKRLYKDTEETLKELKIDLDPWKKARDLSVSQQQMMVIAKNLSQNAHIIILDEPTARLGYQEVIQLLEYIKYMKSKEISVIYISHRLEEVFQICDDITVLRDGKTVGTKPTSELDVQTVIRMMVNREVKNTFEKEETTIGQEVLRVENLSRSNVVNDISFSVRSGEVLGISGLVGAGRTEMVRALLCIDKKDSGKVYLDGKEIVLKNIRDSLKNGLVLVPEERRKQGIVQSLTVRENATIGDLKDYSHLGLINKAKEKKDVKGLIEKLRIRTSGTEQKVGNLSGGNQQKVVLAKWMNQPVKVFFLDEPTRGIDVGAKTEIYRLIGGIAAQGAAVVVVSSELLELQAVCDRVLVMKEGRIKAEVMRDELESETVLRHAIDA